MHQASAMNGVHFVRDERVFLCVAYIWSDILQCDKLWTTLRCKPANYVQWWTYHLNVALSEWTEPNWNEGPKFTVEGMCWPITKMSRKKSETGPVSVIGAVTYRDRNRAHQRLYKRQIKFWWNTNVELVPTIFVFEISDGLLTSRRMRIELYPNWV